MIRYLPMSSNAAANRLTETLWFLAVPAAYQDGHVTKALFGKITCTDNSTWLVVVDDFEIAVHNDAELDGIADVIQPLIDSGDLPPGTNGQIAAAIAQARGGKAVAWQMLPTGLHNKSKTRDELISLGLIEPI